MKRATNARTRHWRQQLATALCVAVATSIVEGDTLDAIDNGSWSDADNWRIRGTINDHDVPSPGDLVYIEGGLEINYDNTTTSFATPLSALYVRNDDSADPSKLFFDVSGVNTLSVGDAYIGFNDGQSARYGRVEHTTGTNLFGTLNLGGTLGQGVYKQTGGTVTVGTASAPGTFYIGGSVGSTYELRGGTLTVHPVGVHNWVGAYIVQPGSSFLQYGGDHNVVSHLMVDGSYKISGGNLSGGDLIIGRGVSTGFGPMNGLLEVDMSDSHLVDIQTLEIGGDFDNSLGARSGKVDHQRGRIIADVVRVGAGANAQYMLTSGKLTAGEVSIFKHDSIEAPSSACEPLAASEHLGLWRGWLKLAAADGELNTLVLNNHSELCQDGGTLWGSDALATVHTHSGSDVVYWWEGGNIGGTTGNTRVAIADGAEMRIRGGGQSPKLIQKASIENTAIVSWDGGSGTGTAGDFAMLRGTATVPPATPVPAALFHNKINGLFVAQSSHAITAHGSGDLNPVFLNDGQRNH